MTAAGAEMRVQFDATLDDFVDAALRQAAHSSVMKGWRWQEVGLTGVLCGIVCSALSAGPFGNRLFWGLFGGAISAALYPWIRRRTLNRRLHKYFREQLKTSGPVEIQVEVSASGISTWQLGSQATHDWTAVETIQDTPDSIDIFTASGGVIVVRKRAFRSELEQKEFLALARQFHSERTQRPTS